MFVTFDVVAGTCEVGCWLEPAGTGKGLVTKVAQRLGMRLDGTLRSSFPYRGVRHDTEVWSLLSSDI